VYEYLEGRIAERGAARLVVDVGGVGYDLSVPVGAPFPAVGEPGVRVWTHMVVREDDQRLYGFPDRETRDLFRLILKVRGVGPAMALGILSGLGRGAFLRAVGSGDAASLTAIKGVGRKTADQILLDLRDHAGALLAAAGEEAGPGAALPEPARGRVNVEDAVAALVSLGYSAKDARKHVDRAARDVDPIDLESLVRQALQG